MSDEILWRVDADVATVTLNRPDKRNAMNAPLLAALRACIDELDERRDVRVIVVRAAGPAFCAGMDLREMEAHPESAGDPEAGVVSVLRRLERARPATIAMVQGDAIAGGCELALHCDLRIAADGARFGMPLARVGLVVPFALAQKLLEVIGPAHTRYLVFTGRPIAARRAYEIGLVHEVTPARELETTTYALARTIAANAPLSIAGLKATIARALSVRDSVAHDDLDVLARRARQSADASEGRRAMLDKRPPVFRGQ